MSHINHEPERIAEAERSIKATDVDRLTDLQHALRKPAAPVRRQVFAMNNDCCITGWGNILTERYKKR